MRLKDNPVNHWNSALNPSLLCFCHYSHVKFITNAWTSELTPGIGLKPCGPGERFFFDPGGVPPGPTLFTDAVVLVDDFLLRLLLGWRLVSGTECNMSQCTFSSDCRYCEKTSHVFFRLSLLWEDSHVFFRLSLLWEDKSCILQTVVTVRRQSYILQTAVTVRRQSCIFRLLLLWEDSHVFFRLSVLWEDKSCILQTVVTVRRQSYILQTVVTVRR